MTDLPDLIGGDDTPLPDAPGDGLPGDDITDLTTDDVPPVAEGDGGPEVDPDRPDPCTAEGDRP